MILNFWISCLHWDRKRQEQGQQQVNISLGIPPPPSPGPREFRANPGIVTEQSLNPSSPIVTELSQNRH